MTLILIVLIVIALAAAAVRRERGRSAARLQEAETAAEGLIAERNALGGITTVIAHHEPVEKIFAQVIRYTTSLIGGTRARLEPLSEAGGRNRAGEVRAIVMAGDEKWGSLVVDGVTASQLPAARLQLLQNFADLAGLAVSTANTRTALMSQSRTDPLTGLANQRAFHRELAEEMSRARRHHRPLALILLDIDQFKKVNDTEGPLGGDRALVEIAKRVRGALRLEAHVARLGGDELAVVLPECDANGGYVTAERIRKAVGAEETAAGNRVTASAGVAVLEPTSDGGMTFLGGTEDLIRAADSALYAAKRVGGDTTIRFTPKLETVAVNPQSRRAPHADAAQSA